MRRRSSLRAAGTVLLTGLIAGIPMAVAAVPGVALIGLSTVKLSDRFADLPASLRTPRRRNVRPFTPTTAERSANATAAPPAISRTCWTAGRLPARPAAPSTTPPRRSSDTPRGSWFPPSRRIRTTRRTAWGPPRWTTSSRSWRRPSSPPKPAILRWIFRHRATPSPTAKTGDADVSGSCWQASRTMGYQVPRVRPRHPAVPALAGTALFPRLLRRQLVQPVIMMSQRRFMAVVAAAMLLMAGCTADPAPQPPTTPTTPADGLPAVVAAVEPSVVTVIIGVGLGSGVVFRDGGLVLTNQHVVGEARTVQLGLADGTRVPATVVATDAVTDLAVLQAERTDLVPARFRTELPRPGETVLAMGSPLGFVNSVTAGIVSGLGREIPGSARTTRALVDLIQTDAAISPGNSGGALVDVSGRVVGINEAYLPPSTGAVAIGFAIPAATAIDVADDLLDDGTASHPYIGVGVARLTPQIAAALGIDRDSGVFVRDVVRGSPSASVLAAGDIIIAFNGQPTDTIEAFLGAMRSVEPGQSAAITIVRDGRERQVTVAIGTLHDDS